MKKNKKWRFPLVMINFAILFAVCGEELMDSAINTATPVVESYLFTESNAIAVKVYTMESFEEEISFNKPVKGLEIYVNDRLLTETTAGNYSLTLQDEHLSEGDNYKLQFIYNHKTISAETLMPERTKNIGISQPVIYKDSYSMFWGFQDSIPEVTVTWDNPDDSFYQVYVHSVDQSTGSYPQWGNNKSGFGNMMMQPFRGNSYTLRPNDMSFFGNYILVLYKVNNDYVELYERISSSDLANPVSAVANAWGIFTGMSADTIRYQVRETVE